MNNRVDVARRDVPTAAEHRLSYVDRLPAHANRPAARLTGAAVHTADPLATVALVARPSSSLAAGPSARERDVLRLLADGYSTREVALRLAYSERTIKNVVQNFTSRLHLRNRTQAVAHAVRNGWI